MMTLKQKIAQAIVEANQRYINKYGSEDWGTCGFAECRMYFGRKTKVRKELQEIGILCNCAYSDWRGRYYNTLNYFEFLDEEQNAQMLPVQTIDWYEAIYRAIANVLKEEYPLMVNDIHMNSWVD